MKSLRQSIFYPPKFDHRLPEYTVSAEILINIHWSYFLKILCRLDPCYKSITVNQLLSFIEKKKKSFYEPFIFFETPFHTALENSGVLSSFFKNREIPRAEVISFKSIFDKTITDFDVNYKMLSIEKKTSILNVSGAIKVNINKDLLRALISAVDLLIISLIQKGSLLNIEVSLSGRFIKVFYTFQANKEAVVELTEKLIHYVKDHKLRTYIDESRYLLFAFPKLLGGDFIERMENKQYLLSYILTLPICN